VISLRNLRVALFAALATVAAPTLIDASSSTQVEKLGSLVVPRTGHVSTVLSDGRVLITGGRDNAGNIVAVSEIFGPATGTSTASATLTTPRVDHTATLLHDGRVLVAGGSGETGAVASAEIFDPANPSAGFRVLSSTMSAARAGHTATPLNNGTVLIAGGDAAGTAEIFDPTTESFTPTLWNLAVPRTGHTATLFSDDSVLLAGGNTDSMELFTPADQKFTLDSQKMSAARTGHWALELSDTRLLFFEGDTGHTVDEFNPPADTLTLKDTLDAAASSATLLANGKVLVLGPAVAGLYDPNAVAPNPAFTAFDETSVPNSSMLLRTGETATELSGDKKILVAGGVDAQKLFPVPALFNPAKIWTDKDDYQPGDSVVLSGSGWKPNENVYLYAVDSQTQAWTYGSTVTADANGAFVVDPYFIVQLVQDGANFSVTAVGAQSALQAEVKFTDSTFTSLTVGSQTGTVTVGTAASPTYDIAATFSNSSGSNTVTFSLAWSGTGPSGVSTSFTPTSVTQPGGSGTQHSSLKITTSSTTPAGSYNFTVSGTPTSGSTRSGTGTLLVQGLSTSLSVSSASGTYGGTVSLSAMLTSSGTGVNGKTIAFTLNGSSVGSATTNASGVATLNNVSLSGINAGTYASGVGASFAADGTYNTATGTASLTVAKATPTITWPDPAGITYPAALNGTQLNATASVAGSFVYNPASGTVLNAGSNQALNVTFTPTDTTNYNTASKTVHINVAKATPTFTSVSTSQTITQGTASITVNGKLSAGTGVVPTGETATITVDSAPAASSSGFNGNQGNFSATIDTHSVPAGTYTITYSYAGDINFNSATNTSTALTVIDAATTLFVSPASGTYGGTVNLSATLTLSSNNSGVSGKTVSFTLNGNSVGNASTDANGVATLNSVSLSGINVGTYVSAIAASFAGGSGFAASNGSASLTVAKANATWTTNPNSKTYGDADPNPLTTGSGNGFLAGDNVTATYSRAAGETVAGGPYHITATLAPVAVLSNYNVTNNGADFTISKRDATWTTNANSKTYGVADPIPLTTGSGSGFLFSDNVTASYSRIAGETVAGSPYHITATLNATAGVLANYNVTNDGADFTIAKRDATWTTNPNSKIYGDADPNPLTTGSGNGFLAGDNVTAAYSRVAGETVTGGPYHITATLAPAAVLSNYNVANNGADFTINKRDATWTTNANSKTYGDADPNPLTSGNGSGFVAGDNVTATYSRAVGETVAGGPYHITATLSPAAVLSNYNVANNGADFTINKRDATWTTNANSKTYGSADPNPLTTGSGSGFLTGDNVTATYSRAAGETVAGGPYHITATLSPSSALSNYNITNAGADFTINKAHLTVTADDKSKTYDGHIFTAFTATITGFVNGDTTSTVTGTPAFTGNASGASNAGTYTITPTQGTLAAANYDFPAVNFKNGTLTINKADATWTTNNASKTYGDADPNPLTTGSGNGFLAADNVTATYSRVAGETVVGSPYHITATLSPAGVLSNYNITNAGADFTINKKDATWTTNSNSKTYGAADPVPLTTGSGNGFLFSDSVAASYSRAAGETVAGSPYHITATLSAGAGVLDNYNITNAGADFTINKRDASVTPNAASKIYGNADPTLAGTLTGFLAADGVSATYSRMSGETVAGSPYTISATLSPAGVLGNYSITYNTADFTINKRAATWTTNANTKTYGDADPNPLSTGSGNFLAADGVTVTYSRAAGETVAGSPYHITATLSAGAGVLDNYNITNAGADFTINKRDASVTPNAANKIYGDADPTLTGTLAGFVAADGVSPTYSRTAGESVAGSPYTISAALSPVGVLGNYDITYNTAEFTIKKRDATWTTNANSKTYGDLDPAPLTTGNGTNFVDTVTASYSRAAGETAAGTPYHITATLSPAGVLANYNITNAGADFTINKRAATWTTNANSKTYGDLDPAPLTTGSGTNFVDAVTASYSRVAGETVGGSPYHITATLSAAAGVLANYDITNAGADFTINRRPATWTINPNSKTYGDADPTPLTTGSGSGFVDAVSASYSRAAGESVAGSPYHITATLSAAAGVLANYDITNAGADFTINKAHLTVTADNKSKTYDAHTFSAFTATITGFVNNETSSVVSGGPAFSGSAITAINAGPPYTITPTLGTLAADNYDFAFKDGTFTINKADAGVSVTGYSGTYDGLPHGATGSVTGVDAGGAAAGSNLNLGSPFTNYPGGTAHWVFTGGTNYNDQSGDVAIVINKVHLTVTGDNKSKTYDGSVFTGFTATLSGFVHSETDAALRSLGTLAGSAGFSGNAVGAVPAGTYTITPTQGTLSATNYDFTSFVNGTLTIGKAHLTVTADSSKSVQYSDPLPTLTWAMSGFVNNETEAGLRSAGALSGAPSFTTSAIVTSGNVFSGPGQYTITPAVGTLAATNYDFPAANFVKGTLTVTQEDARATYTGDMFVSTATPSATTATVTLRATIQDITAVPTDPAYDPYPGVITNATVTFVNRDSGNAVIAANVPATLIGSDTKTGTASFSWTVSLGTAPSVTYHIGIIVNGYYTDNMSTEDTVVTVSQLTPGSINGGGYLVVQSSAGAYAGSAGMKNNFGFNVQNTKTGVKGNINAIIRSNGHIYQIKGNSMTSLYTSVPPNYPTNPSTGTFNGKAAIQDVTNPNAQPISLDGNATLQVTMTDYGQPTKDTIGITVWSKTGALDFSSNWTGAKTVEQTLGGGNLAVR
jgi:hypothetical protein